MRLDPLLPANPFGSSEHWTHMSNEPPAQEVRRNGVRLVQWKMKFKTCREQKEKDNMVSYPDSKQTLGSSFHCWVMVALVKGFVANLGDPTQGFSEDLQCSRPTSAPSEHG